MKLLLVRHGQTDWNIDNLLQGSTDMPLNQKGIADAKTLGEMLKDVPIDEIYCSNLSRSRDTALCVRGERDIPVKEDRRVAEMDFGTYEGLPSLGWKPEEKFEHVFFTDPESYIPPEGAEDFAAIMARIGDFLATEITPRAEEDRTVLIAAHGISCKALMCHLEKLPLKQFWGPEGRLMNCECRAYAFKDGGWQRDTV